MIIPYGVETEIFWVKKVNIIRAHRFPLPDGPGQVRLPVGQVDLDRFFFFISYKQIEEFQNSWSRASDDFEKRWGLIMIADAHFVSAPSQWKMTLQCNVVSHWLAAYTKWSLHKPWHWLCRTNGSLSLTRKDRIGVIYWAPSQYKDRLIYVWRFPC